MTSRYWRALISHFLLGVALEYALCVIVAAIFLDGKSMEQGLILLLALWALQIILGAKNLLISIATYYLFRKRRLVREFEIALHTKKFPFDEDAFSTDAVEYMHQIARNPNPNQEQVMTAAGFLGQIEALKATKPSLAMQMMSSMDAALDRYRHEVAKRTAGPLASTLSR